MTVATGRSNVRAEIDLMGESLKLMIKSIESHFREILDSLKAQIFDVEHGNDTEEEKSDICKPYFDALEEYEIQRFHARNKLVISIYSICEASLAGICNHYRVPLKRSPKNKMSQFYLTDYLYSIGVNYTDNNINSPNVVCEAIRPLRNYLTHCQENNEAASKIVKMLKSKGFTNVEHNNGSIEIESEAFLNEILSQCNEMLLISEETAKNNFEI